MEIVILSYTAISTPVNTTAEGCVAQIVVKLESMNPSASVKARIDASMIEAAEQEKLISPEKTNLDEVITITNEDFIQG